MSDELRDALRARGEAIDVPAGDLSGVVRGGRGLKVRRIAMATTATAVVVAVVAWGATNGRSFLDGDEGQVAVPGPSETATPTPIPSATAADRSAGRCDFVPFRPSYLPEGWSYVLKEGSCGQQGIPLEQQSPRANGHWSFDAAKQKDRALGGFIDVYRQDIGYYSLGDGGEPIVVLGTEARIGDVHEGYAVEFDYEGCTYSVMAFGPPKNELRRVAEGLEPRERCTGQNTRRLTEPLPDGRHFGHIRALNVTALHFDEAEFLTGDEAVEAAAREGSVEQLDYFIADDDDSVASIGLAPDAVVFLETFRQDGTVGLAERELGDVVCTFESDEPIDRFTTEVPYWIVVEDGFVTRIEEQYVP